MIRCQRNPKRRAAEKVAKAALTLLLRPLGIVGVLALIYFESRYLGFTPLINAIEYILRLPE